MIYYTLNPIFIIHYNMNMGNAPLYHVTKTTKQLSHIQHLNFKNS